MKKFIVNVNGKSYEVEVEEVGSSSQPSVQPSMNISAAPTPQPAQPKAAPAPAQNKPKEEPKPVQPVPQGAEIVEAPMPGTILDIKVKPGDMVKKGQVLLILEAMKMENEIMAPRDGKVAAINTSKGSSVNVGDPLVSLE